MDRIWLACAAALAVWGAAPGAFAQQNTPVAFVERVYPVQTRLAGVISIVRHGRPVTVTDNADLFPADEIYVLNRANTVTIRMIDTRTLVAVNQHGGGGKKAPDYRVPASQTPGLLGRAFEFMKTEMLGVDQSHGDTAAASRLAGRCFNETGSTNQPLQFDVPVLSADRSYLSPGDRQLFISWRGGAPPFSVVFADAVTGKILARQTVAPDHCHAVLPPVPIAPGTQYRLAVIDGNGVREEDANIFGAKQSPAMPAQLQAASLPEDARRLYFATWLSIQGQGEWMFEAEQRVTALGCQSGAVQAWLKAATKSTECSDR